MKSNLVASACVLCAALALSPAASQGGHNAGFLNTEFIHEEVPPNEEFQNLVRLVSRDSLAANIQHLQDYGTRFAYTPEVKRAGRWLMKRFAGFGYPDTLFQSVIMGDGKVTLATGNVGAIKPGKTRPEYQIIIGSHYDCVTYDQAVPPAEVAPGADDNASGTSGVLELARLLVDVDLDATVKFVSFTGHEVGMLGSYEFATDLAEEGIPADKLFFINLDMIGNASGPSPWRLKIHDNTPSRPLAELAARIGEAYTPLTMLMAGPREADHVNFHNQGYRAIFLHEGDFNDPNYHSITDLLENLEMDFEEQVVEMTMAMVLHLAKLAEPPGDVRAARDEAGDVLVQWSHSLDGDVVGYNVELIDSRGEVADSLFTRDNSVVMYSSALGDTMWVRVSAEDLIGAGDPSDPVFVGTGPRMLAEAVPNPATSGSTVSLFVPGVGPSVKVSVDILDTAGRLVTTLHDGPIGRGPSNFTWSGTFSNGDRVPTGVYFYVVEAAGVGKTSGKIMVVR